MTDTFSFTPIVTSTFDAVNHFSEMPNGIFKHSCGTARTHSGLEVILAAARNGQKAGNTNRNTFINNMDGSGWEDQGPPPSWVRTTKSCLKSNTQSLNTQKQ